MEQASSSPDELRTLGADAADATELSHLHRTYFGHTRFTGKQRKARATALQQRHSLATLTLIESYTARVKKTSMPGTSASHWPAHPPTKSEK